MIEIVGDLFEQECDAICITTNGFVRQDGHLTMGRGCAYEAKMRWPKLSEILGTSVRDFGNEVYLVNKHRLGSPYHIISFPVKRHFMDKASLFLIKQSRDDLLRVISLLDAERVVLPRPGCGNGGLNWKAVKKGLEPLPDSIVIISKED